jgi:hypothetical protein
MWGSIELFLALIAAAATALLLGLIAHDVGMPIVALERPLPGRAGHGRTISSVYVAA